MQDTTQGTLQKATFGAGCFWGVEAAFREIPGVLDAVVGLRGRNAREPDLSRRLQRPHGSRRSRRSQLRPGAGELRAAARRVLRAARSDHAEPSRPGRRVAVSLGRLLPRRRAARSRRSCDRAPRCGGSVPATDRHARSSRRKRSIAPKTTTSAISRRTASPATAELDGSVLRRPAATCACGGRENAATAPFLRRPFV